MAYRAMSDRVKLAREIAARTERQARASTQGATERDPHPAGKATHTLRLVFP